MGSDASKVVPQYAPSAAYRQLEFLLGRISSLTQTGDFTTQSGNFTGSSGIPKQLKAKGGFDF